VVETELKFQVPSAARARVRQAVATRTARTLHLRARYFDTPDGRLAAAGLALRLRLEGRQWVQTLKGRGDGALERLEHEVPVAGERGAPVVDLARHAGTWAEPALAAALGKDGGAALRLVFEADVYRTLRTVHSGKSQIEIAFDTGALIAGAARRPICEIEFELKRGQKEALIALASRWVGRHGLWLDVRSKAERGERLSRGVDGGPATSAERPALGAQMSGDAALRAIVGTCLAQVLPNAADLAAGVGSAEHLHQLRVGLRRLRCALRMFGRGAPALDAAWAPALAALFGSLGAARDRDVLAASVLPELQRAGAPLAELPDDTGADDPTSALRSAEWTILMLELIGFSHGRAAAEEARDRSAARHVVPLARAQLRRMQRQLKADAAAFLTLDDARRHRARRRLKRLRYSLEFVASLFPPRLVQRCLKRISPAQDLLGRYNDLCVAEAAFRAQMPQDPRAWFAVGWLVAQRAQLVPETAKALARLAKLANAWPARR
jgi:triphosphatase